VKRLSLFSQRFGLHPVTAMGMFLVDWMLFGEEVATAGIGWVISLPVGAALGIAAAMIQKRVYRDSTTAAVAKGLLVGLLTAIPAPLSSLGLLPLVAFGIVRAASSKRRTAPAAIQSQSAI
jgi:hypothetical protein